MLNQIPIHLIHNCILDSRTQNTRRLDNLVRLQEESASNSFEYDDQFEQLLDELGIREVIGEDDAALRTMWNNLKVTGIKNTPTNTCQRI